MISANLAESCVNQTERSAKDITLTFSPSQIPRKPLRRYNQKPPSDLGPGIEPISRFVITYTYRVSALIDTDLSNQAPASSRVGGRKEPDAFAWDWDERFTLADDKIGVMILTQI